MIKTMRYCWSGWSIRRWRSARPGMCATSPWPIREERFAPRATTFATAEFDSSRPGTNGFGYDPLFEVVEYHRTFGELGPAVKRAISHRSRALRAILPKLAALE